MKNDQTKYFATFVDRKPLQKYNEIVGFAVMAEWQTRQLEGLVGVSPVEVRVFLGPHNNTKKGFPSSHRCRKSFFVGFISSHLKLHNQLLRE